MKFPPGEANSEIKWISLLYRNPGNAAACAFVVDYSAVTLWFDISQNHMAMCPSANQRKSSAGRPLSRARAGRLQEGKMLTFYDGLCRDYIGNEKEARLNTPKISVIRAWFPIARGEKRQINKATGIRSSGIILAKKMGEGLLTAPFPNFGGNGYLLTARHVLSEKLSFRG